MNKYTRPWEWHFTKLVIEQEIGNMINRGELDYQWCISVCDEIVRITDEAILKAYHESKV